MNNKKFLLLIISLVLFGVSLMGLVAAMVLHAVFDDGSVAPAIMAIASFMSAFAAIITICFYNKGEKQ